MDQIILITQAIEDRFQSKKLELSVLVLLDYSKSFDQVWRERFLLTMIDKVVPMLVIENNRNRSMTSFSIVKLRLVYMEGKAATIASEMMYHKDAFYRHYFSSSS